MGAWAIEAGPGPSGGQAGYCSVDPGAHFTDARLRTFEQRLMEMRDRDGGGGERMEEGTLVFESFGGFVAGLMLKPNHTPADLERAHADLRYLLDGLTRRPLLHEMAQGQEAPVEGSRSIALRLVHQLERLLDAHAIVVLLEPAGPRIVAVSGGADQRLVGRVVPEQSPLARVARGLARSMQVKGGALAELLPDRRDQRRTQISLLHLQDLGEPLGAVAFWRTPSGPLPGAALAEVRQLLHQAEPRFLGALKMEQDRQAARTDQLTGLPNRAALEGHMHDVRNARGRGSLIMADLDKFKSLNDSLGHPAGDAALIHFARILGQEVREHDVAARVGGEEFAVWLPHTSMADAARVAERIREHLEGIPWDWQGRGWSLSASFGVAGCPEVTSSLDNLMGRADAALYEAKRRGRNRVGLAPTAG